jgi:glycosyltransferase involved in cell wall biosynthesis
MNKKLNVLYIITKLELGGAQKVCLSLIDGLNKSNNNAILISGKEGKLIDKIQGLSNVILLDSFKREISLKYIFLEIYNFVNLIKKIKVLKKEFPDLIVHTHSTKAGLIGRWAAFFAGIQKRIHTVHGFAFHNHQNKFIWLLIYIPELITSVITTHFVCVSTADIKTGIKLFPGFNKKHSLIRASVDKNKFIPTVKINKLIKDSIFVFGSVACFKKQKNLIDLFKAFETVYNQNNNCRLEVIGDGQLRNELENWILKHNLVNKIILHGWQENVAEFMTNWNAFVLSSLWEGLPCAIIEARLIKLPVITYNTGGISDVIINGKNGFICRQKDYIDLASKMLSLMTNKNLYMRLKNYNEDLNDFDTNYMIKKHINLYKHLS